MVVWNEHHYPKSMGQLPRDVRVKAIEMANVLHLEQGFSRDYAVDLAIARAQMWAQRYGRELASEAPRPRPARRIRPARLETPSNAGGFASRNTRPPVGDAPKNEAG